MNSDPKAVKKINQVIKAVCKEWGVSESEVRQRNKRSRQQVTDARRAICYLVKTNNNVKVPRFVLANTLGGLNGAQVSKYVICMTRWAGTYPEMREKIERAARNTPFLVIQLKFEFKGAA